MSILSNIEKSEIRLNTIQSAVRGLDSKFHKAAKDLNIDLMSKITTKTIEATLLITNESSLPEWILTEAKAGL